MALAIIKNTYNTGANLTGIVEMGSEKLFEAAEMLLDEQFEMFMNGRPARFAQAKMEDELELTKLQIKTAKMKAKLDTKLAELNSRTEPTE